MRFQLAESKRLISMKKSKTHAYHTTSSPKGMGDFYGTGIRAKIGTSREDLRSKLPSPQSLKVPPKKLA